MRNRLLKKILISIAVLACAPALAGRVTAPKSIQVEGQPLELVGEAVQKKFIFDIYAIALYMERPTTQPSQIVASDQLKRVRIRMLRDAKREQVVNALKDGFLKGNPPGVSALSPELERLLAAIPDVKSGHELTITYVPNGGTTFETRDGVRMRVPGKAFADALLNVWLGQDPGTKKLQRELLRRG